MRLSARVRSLSFCFATLSAILLHSARHSLVDPMPSVSDWLSSASLSFSSNKDVIDDAIVVADAPDLGRGDATTSHEHVIASKRVLGLVEVRAGLCAASGVLSLALLRDSSRICLTSSIEYLSLIHI